MWGLLRLLVQHVVVGVADERSVVRVEKHLVRNLKGIKSNEEHVCVENVVNRIQMHSPPPLAQGSFL